MKIDPYNFPMIIIMAFVIGLILAMALGFRPVHGSSTGKGHSSQPVLMQVFEMPKGMYL
ncbi:hypothetical protein MASR2M66_25210 [Chloroflexota bacterium]